MLNYHDTFKVSSGPCASGRAIASDFWHITRSVLISLFALNQQGAFHAPSTAIDMATKSALLVKMIAYGDMRLVHKRTLRSQRQSDAAG
jgi:hypothetical protein